MRWKAAAGLGIDDEGFDASVLTLWRQRLRANDTSNRYRTRHMEPQDASASCLVSAHDHILGCGCP